MLRQAIQGARLCQHVTHGSPSVPSFSSRRAFSVVGKRSIDYGGPNDKIHFYEQNTLGSRKRRKVDPEAEDQSELGAVENELHRLDQELKVLQEGPYGPNSPLMKSLPEKDRAIALEALRKHEEEVGEDKEQLSLEDVFDNELDEELRSEFEGLAVEQENLTTRKDHGQRKKVIQSTIPREREPFEVILPDGETHPYIDQFNICLEKFVRDKSDESVRQRLWKWYRRCKMASSNFLKSVPEETANLLWESQTQGESTKPTRLTHLQTLFLDDNAVGRTQSTPYLLSYIESLHENGEISHALDLWETYQGQISAGMRDSEKYWKLGVHLFAADGNPQRAQDIALAFLASNHSREPRILIPVITGWGRQPGEEAGVKAWVLYLRLKTLLRGNMTMDDYDNVSIGLLKARRSDLALAVFKDMMVTYQSPENDSMALYLRLAGNLQAVSINEEEVNRISLSALTFLPKRFHNRFFFASWMKKLIGMGEVDSAAMVVELMYEKGIRPDTKHLNGIIAAWLREGNLLARTKMESLGWGMIHKRIDDVSARDSQTRHSDQAKRPTTTRRSRLTERRVPPANIETFSILLLHYTRRSNDDMVQDLAKCLVDARIKPNSYFMNHLLYMSLRKQDITSVWQKFENMSSAVHPDLETFACLWDCGKLQYDISRVASSEIFPSARDLYSEMMQWYSQLPERSKLIAREEFSKDLYDQIIRCFCLLKDLPGTLVAMHSMQTTFQFFPDDMTTRILVLQVARMAGVPEGTPTNRLRRLSSTPRIKENIKQVYRLLEVLSEIKTAFLQSNGLELDQLDPHEKPFYKLEIMSDLLRAVMSRFADDPGSVEKEITDAASQMSVLGIDLGSALGKENPLL